MCLCGGKSVVQKFVLEFRSHSLGSILCKRKKCSAKVCVGIWNTIPKEVFCVKGNGVVLRRRIAKEVVSRKLYANPKNILKTR